MEVWAKDRTKLSLLHYYCLQQGSVELSFPQVFCKSMSNRFNSVTLFVLTLKSVAQPEHRGQTTQSDPDSAPLRESPGILALRTPAAPLRRPRRPHRRSRCCTSLSFPSLEASCCLSCDGGRLEYCTPRSPRRTPTTEES